MIYLQKKRYKKFVGITIKGFSFPELEKNIYAAEGVVVGYGKKDLVVRCLNVQGWESDRCKIYHELPLEKGVSDYGYWFVSLEEIKESLLNEKRNSEMDKMINNGEIVL
jgi:hypothetical protein